MQVHILLHLLLIYVLPLKREGEKAQKREEPILLFYSKPVRPEPLPTISRRGQVGDKAVAYPQQALPAPSRGGKAGKPPLPSLPQKKWSPPPLSL